MSAFLVGLSMTLIGCYVLSWVISALVFYYRRRSVHRKVAKMNSGVHVEHGMIMNPRTGLLSPQQKPSKHSYSL